MTISMDEEKVFHKIQYPFMIKTLKKLSITGTYLKILKVTYTIPTANVILNNERIKAFPSQSGTSSKSSHTHHMVLDVTARAIR